MEIKRTALVLHSAMDMFRLVQDVPAYPQFLSWCINAEVHEQTAQEQLASLAVRIAGVDHSFTTRNRFVAGEQLTLSLVDGPFSHLSGEWQFKALGDDGSKVTLLLNFDFSSSVLSSAFRTGFAHVADKLVYDFGKRADEVYGD
jgi:ribosome-associated toxin RatA of RatAB toxin-antitoxin module